jgi:hypothetical protein
MKFGEERDWFGIKSGLNPKRCGSWNPYFWWREPHRYSWNSLAQAQRALKIIKETYPESKGFTIEKLVKEGTWTYTSESLTGESPAISSVKQLLNKWN